ncbi:MAG: HXXEE domain-containing protein [Candidatus Sulfotelmatobacter sp.]
MGFRNLLWLFPIVITLHNAEEAIWLSGWSKEAGRWPATVTPGVFRFGAAFLTIAAFAVTWLSFRSDKQTVWIYLTFGYMVAMLANVLIPHVGVSVVLRSYMPGLATAVALNLPVLSLLVVLALREKYVSGWKAAAYSVGVPVLLLLSIPALFKLGRALKSLNIACRALPLIRSACFRIRTVSGAI